MLWKVLMGLLAVLFFYALFFPRRVPSLFRRAGRSTGDLGRAGREMVSAVEEEQSPLARYEVRVGEMVGAKLLAENPLSTDERLQALVTGIGTRLAAHAQRRHIPYRFAVVEAAEPNAFAVPGGSIYVARPMLELCGWNEDWIAGVLGHEVIHVDRRHALHGLAASMAVRTGVKVLTLGRGALLAQIAGGVEGLLTRGYSQDQELEADLFGARLAGLAGFDASGAVALLEHVARVHPEAKTPLAEVLAYFRAHPPIAERIARLKAKL